MNSIIKYPHLRHLVRVVFPGIQMLGKRTRHFTRQANNQPFNAESMRRQSNIHRKLQDQQRRMKEQKRTIKEQERQLKVKEYNDIAMKYWLDNGYTDFSKQLRAMAEKEPKILEEMQCRFELKVPFKTGIHGSDYAPTLSLIEKDIRQKGFRFVEPLEFYTNKYRYPHTTSIDTLVFDVTWKNEFPDIGIDKNFELDSDIIILFLPFIGILGTLQIIAMMMEDPDADKLSDAKHQWEIDDVESDMTDMVMTNDNTCHESMQCQDEKAEFFLDDCQSHR